MGISRLHFALLSIMSIFTGIIAPGTTTRIGSIAYPLTDAKIFSYLLLIFLIIGFYTAAIHAWRYFRYNAILIFWVVGLLFFLTLSGQVIEAKNGFETSGLSWGWIFFFVGIGMLFKAYRGDGSYENPSELRQTIDTLLGIVGSFTLACIAGVIIFISLSISWRIESKSILEKLLWSGSTHTESGAIILSASYVDITSLSYDRKSDALIYAIRNGKNRIYTMINPLATMSFTASLAGTPMLIGSYFILLDHDNRAYSGSVKLSNTMILWGNDTLLVWSGSDWNVRSAKSSWSFDHSGAINRPIISEDHMTLAWIENNWRHTRMMKMGKQEWPEYEKVYSMNLSAWGYDLMALVSSSGWLQIVKNGEGEWNIEAGYITGSYVSNGSHSIYLIQWEKWKNIIYDGHRLPTGYDDVREIFLEKNWGAYAYFAKPLWAIEYCLFTKYRGNICGLDWYMNPRMSADGSSILYAGFHDGIWSIYRNTEVLVKNTNYSNAEVSGDYVFFDITNPRDYLFVKKNLQTSQYTLIKNGKNLPGIWEDFGTDISFGYDNHIILRLKDANGWRMAEI